MLQLNLAEFLNLYLPLSFKDYVKNYIKNFMDKYGVHESTPVLEIHIYQHSISIYIPSLDFCKRLPTNTLFFDRVDYKIDYETRLHCYTARILKFSKREMRYIDTFVVSLNCVIVKD